MNKKKTVSFEQQLEKLEALAELMEQGKLPLHELMQAYEDGLKLSAQLKAELEKAKARMLEVKREKDGTIQLEPSDITQQTTLLDEVEMGE